MDMTENFRLSFLYSDEGRAIYEEGYKVGYELGQGDVQKAVDDAYDMGYEQGREGKYDDETLELARRLQAKASIKGPDDYYEEGRSDGFTAASDMWRQELLNAGILDSHGVAEFLKEMERENE
jgi:hypothetical protein